MRLAMLVSLFSLCDNSLCLQLLDRAVGAAQPAAELAAESRQQFDGNGRRAGRQGGEIGSAQAITDEVAVGADRGRARSGVQDRQLAENRARSKGRKPDVAFSGLTQPGASRSAHDDEKLLARIALGENDAAL